MAKSHTRKKSNNLPPEVSGVVNLFTDYLSYWTRSELGNLQSQRQAVCMPTKDGYKIGLYTLKVYPNKMCEVWDRNDELVHTFRDKISAILYTIYTIKHHFNTAGDILHLDKEINKNYIDVLTMRRCMTSALARKDYYAADIREARLDVSETKLKLAQEKMQAMHFSAKMRKVWE